MRARVVLFHEKNDARGRACLQYSVCAALLREAAQAEPLSYEERADAALEALKHGAQTFSAKFAAAQLRALGGQEENVVLSPVSVYAGLSLAAACAQGETQTQLLSALGVDQAQLSAGFSPFYRSLTANAEDDAGKLHTRLHLANAVYVNEGTQTKNACLDALASDFFCNSYAADFMNDNYSANEAVRRFVREETNGLIDSRFLLPEETVFALVNALYLKDAWNIYGDDLPSAGDMVFSDRYGNGASVPFLRGYYTAGRAYEGETFTSFHADTYAGYQIRFLLPQEGCTADEIFTEENIAELAAVTDYNAVDEENRIRYYTRCLFPAFRDGCDADAREVLEEDFGVTDLFSPETCDLTALTDDAAFCTGVRHIAALRVDEKGIEGAAATVLPAAGSPGPDEYEEVYLDFTVDRAFVFLLTDRCGTILFAGIIGAV